MLVQAPRVPFILDYLSNCLPTNWAARHHRLRDPPGIFTAARSCEGAGTDVFAAYAGEALRRARLAAGDEPASHGRGRRRRLEMFVRKGRASLVAVTPATEHPIHMCTIDGDGMRHALLPGVNGTVRRHDMPPAYRVNGAIYINDADEITLDTSFNDNEVGFVMSAEHSVDVDDFEDFACAERALEGEE